MHPSDPKTAWADPGYRAFASSAAFNRLAFEGSLRALMGTLMGNTAFCYPTKVARVVYPEALVPTHGGRYVHQDFSVIGVQDMFTVWLPLMDIPRRLGGLCVLAGSQSGPLVRPKLFQPGPGWATTDYRAGDMLVFHCLTAHASLPNRTSGLRVSGELRWQLADDPVPRHLVYGPGGNGGVELFSRVFRATGWWRPVPAGLDLVDRSPDSAIGPVPPSRYVDARAAAASLPAGGIAFARAPDRTERPQRPGRRRTVRCRHRPAGPGAAKAGPAPAPVPAWPATVGPGRPEGAHHRQPDQPGRRDRPGWWAVTVTGNLGFDLSEHLDEVLAGLRRFVEAEVVARHEGAGQALADPRVRYRSDGLLSDEALALIREVRTASAAAGYYGMFVPEPIGGGGLGSEALYRVWEDLHHRFGLRYWLMPWVVAHWARGPSHVLVHATEAARERVLPGLLSGRTSMCFAMSEPDAGSDARTMRTTAVADGDDWVISGSKIWISNGPYAELAVVFARVAPPPGTSGAGRISAFLVPTDTEGFRAEGTIRMFGEVGGDEAVLHFDEVKVGADMVLGQIGDGFAIAMSGVASGRLYNSARAVGLARWAIELAAGYATGRQAFGRPISEHQGVAFPLAESAMEIHAAHLMGLNCALLLDRGGQATKELSMAKAFSTEAAVRAVDRVIQAHGAIGLTNDLGLVDAYHAVRKACVADGTSEILRRAIAGRLFGGDLEL